MKAITFEHKSSVPWLSKVYGICGIYNCPQLQIPYTLGSHCTYKCALNIRISEKEICQLHVNVLNRAWMNHCILQVLFCTRCVYTQHYSRCLCDFYTYSHVYWKLKFPLHAQSQWVQKIFTLTLLILLPTISIAAVVFATGGCRLSRFQTAIFATSYGFVLLVRLVYSLLLELQ